ncbi:RNA-binding protein [Pedobacter sp. MC2016-14]|uniref:RNA recognition motif domain-containing protein n=1 Tax=Pedobacter sp. MC2016-14 TaxID=2897327 RepID=UPI001E402019|nr:RNA-binding protein [Pedobacter sp. MC2016-14]MCD0489812.1 RNA-binding protein [Pedobacter sp. MC2016-14]
MRKIFVGGLSSETSEMELVIFISIYARVDTIKIVREKSTQKPKGYAFLEMFNDNEAAKAVAEVNGLTFKGNTLTVKLTEEEPPKVKAYVPVNKFQKNKRPRKRI